MIKQTLNENETHAVSSSYFFHIGSQELASRLRSSGSNEEYVFLDFEGFNTQLLMLSNFIQVAQKYKSKKIVLISSLNLLPLAYSFVSHLGADFSLSVFTINDSLSHVYAMLSVSAEEKTSGKQTPERLSVKELLILEYTLKGYSAGRLGKIMNLSAKTIFHWRSVICKKLDVRKLQDLLCGVCM